MNLRILIFVIDLRTTGSFNFQGLNEIFDLISEPPWLQSEIASRLFPRIEMLVKPFCRRYEDRPRPSVDATARLSGLLQQGITFS
jgi:hypothetical protein